MPLWRYLTALVLLPLVGVVVLAAAAAQARADEAAGAERADRAMRSLALLDAARSGAEQELIPVLSLSVIGDPGLAASLGIPENLIQMQRSTAIEEAARARQRTDDALSRIRPGSIGGAAAQRAAADLADLRTVSVGGDLDIDDVYLRFLAVSTDLMTAQEAAAAAATSEGVPDATMRAIRDVQAIARLTQIASRQMPLYLGSMFVAGDDSIIGSSTAWRTSWLDYSDAQGQMDELSQASLRTAWDEVRTSDAVAGIDALLADGLVGAGASPPSLGNLVTLLFGSQERSALLSGLVTTALDEAQALVSADREHAGRALQAVLLLGAAILAGSLIGAVFLGRSVARALRLLAGQATQISEGSLVEVEVAGPREVRTVSAALRSAVAGLRRIQDQAQAVARGDLDNSLLDQPLPGPLGEVVHASVREIVHSVRQREELQFALAHQATHDALTELPNRAQAVALVTSALHRGRRSGEMTGLLFVDLDGFKAVNDGHGHAAGDEVLRSPVASARPCGPATSSAGSAATSSSSSWSPCTASTTCSTWPPA